MSYIGNKLVEATVNLRNRRVARKALKKGISFEQAVKETKSPALQAAASYLSLEKKFDKLLSKMYGPEFPLDSDYDHETERKVRVEKKGIQVEMSPYRVKNPAAIEIKTITLLLTGPAVVAALPIVPIVRHVKYKKEEDIVKEVCAIIESASDIVKVEKPKSDLKKYKKDASAVHNVYNIDSAQGLYLVRYDNSDNGCVALIQVSTGEPKIIANITSTKGINKIIKTRDKKLKEIEKTKQTNEQNLTLETLRSLHER